MGALQLTPRVRKTMNAMKIVNFNFKSCRQSVNTITLRSWVIVTFLYMLGIVLSSLIPGGGGVEKEPGFLDIVCNYLHIPAYAGLTFLLFFVVRNFAFQYKISALTQARQMALVFMLAVLYGILNEFVQAHVPDRSFSYADMCRNALGAGGMLVVIKFLK